MKEIETRLKLYQCEYCDTRYKNIGECKACEDNHITPVRIVRAKYHASKIQQNYPDVIFVEMADGKTIKYKR